MSPRLDINGQPITGETPEQIVTRCAQECAQDAADAYELDNYETPEDLERYSASHGDWAILDMAFDERGYVLTTERAESFEREMIDELQRLKIEALEEEYENERLDVLDWQRARL